jgi:hypothetical protein
VAHPHTACTSTSTGWSTGQVKEEAAMRLHFQDLRASSSRLLSWRHRRAPTPLDAAAT